MKQRDEKSRHMINGSLRSERRCAKDRNGFEHNISRGLKKYPGENKKKLIKSSLETILHFNFPLSKLGG